MILSFPNWNQPWCAWVALVPWLASLPDLTRRQAFWSSCLVGLAFFLGSIWWLIHVTLVGWIVLCLYLGLFFGLFGWIAHPLLDGRSPRLAVLAVPSAWVMTEWLRSRLLSGFGWNLLAYSQAPVLPIIQIAEVTGAWGVSFLIVAVNVGLLQTIRGRGLARRTAPAVVAAGLVVAAWLYGLHCLARPRPAAGPRIALVQGNIPQEHKWDEAFKEEILTRYAALTRTASALEPALIVWPETAVPGFLGTEEPLTQRITALARSSRTPLLVGAPVNHYTPQAWQMTNSAVLIDADGRLVERYDKTHLVPLGEFIPLESTFPWLRQVLPPIGDFVPGREFTVFHLGSRLKVQGSRGDPTSLEPRTSNLEPAFSVLICFEDVFPEIARQCVTRGARLLLTITNDAWFGKTAAAYQHAQASTFRAVELRVPMVRAANTGWSGCIDADGRWRERVRDATGEALFVEGVALCQSAAGSAATPYLRWGDWLALVCGLAVAGWTLARLRSSRAR
ncbi:MAG: apolipoprotein N-acyltransferase [Candidatus Omnitrophica bacterium]|nr:apolipoprotein N-acyltransferase [Candidatus Omnitrophota bacterium]